MIATELRAVPRVSATVVSSNLFDQYKLFAEETSRIGDRRQTTNNLFLQVNSVLLGAVALLIQQAFSKGTNETAFLFLGCLLVGAGAVLCGVWLVILREYDRRLRSRFEYLRQLESDHPELLINAYSFPDSKRQRKLRSLSLREALVPVIFLITYLAAAVGAVALTQSWLNSLHLF